MCSRLDVTITSTERGMDPALPKVTKKSHYQFVISSLSVHFQLIFSFENVTVLVRIDYRTHVLAFGCYHYEYGTWYGPCTTQSNKKISLPVRYQLIISSFSAHVQFRKCHRS